MVSQPQLWDYLEYLWAEGFLSREMMTVILLLGFDIIRNNIITFVIPVRGLGLRLQKIT